MNWWNKKFSVELSAKRIIASINADQVRAIKMEVRKSLNAIEQRVNENEQNLIQSDFLDGIAPIMKRIQEMISILIKVKELDEERFHKSVLDEELEIAENIRLKLNDLYEKSLQMSELLSDLKNKFNLDFDDIKDAILYQLYENKTAAIKQLQNRTDYKISIYKTLVEAQPEQTFEVNNKLRTSYESNWKKLLNLLRMIAIGKFPSSLLSIINSEISDTGYSFIISK
jgi:uncharacterized protein YlxP (DUF503 family)